VKVLGEKKDTWREEGVEKTRGGEGGRREA